MSAESETGLGMSNEPSDQHAGADHGSDRLRRGVKAALARWVLQRRGRPGARKPSTRDEATHDFDGRRHFAEDYTFACVQPDLGLIVRLEWLPGREAHRVWVVVLTENGSYAVPGMARGGRKGLVRVTSGDRWRAGGLEIDCVAPHREWTAKFSGRLQPASIAGEGADGAEPGVSDLDPTGDRRCTVDISFVADGDPYVPGGDDDPELVSRSIGEAHWDVRLARRLRRHLSRSYVQLGRVRGTLVIGDEVHAVRADCARSHSWGVRDWAASDTAYQCLLVPDPGVRLWLHHAEFPWLTLEGGFIRGEDSMLPVRTLGTSMESRPGRGPGRMGFSVDDGRNHVAVQAAVASDLAIDVDGRGRLEFALVRADVAGRDESGWGLWVWQRRLLPRP